MSNLDFSLKVSNNYIVKAKKSVEHQFWSFDPIAQGTKWLYFQGQNISQVSVLSFDPMRYRYLASGKLFKNIKSWS